MVDPLSPSQTSPETSQSFLLAPENGWTQIDSIPLSDRGFRYGMHLFESFARIDGHAEFLEAHLARLETSARLLHYQPQPGWQSDIHELLRKIPNSPSLFGRIYVTAGDGAPHDPPSAARVIVTLEPRSRCLPGSYALVPVDCPVHGDDQPDSGFLKSGHYRIRCECLQNARRRGADEALLLHPRQGALTASMANFFWKHDGHWHTAPAGQSVRNGVWREWWIRQTGAAESHLTPSDIHRLEAAALTSSWLGVMPVHRIGEINLPERAPRITAEPRPCTP